MAESPIRPGPVDTKAQEICVGVCVCVCAQVKHGGAQDPFEMPGATTHMNQIPLRFFP